MQNEIEFYCFSYEIGCEPSFGDLGVTYAPHLHVVEKPWSTFYSSLLNFFRYFLRMRRCEGKSVEVGVFQRGWITLGADFRGREASPTNHRWCQISRVIGLSCGIKMSTVHHSVFFTTHACDRHTDGQTDGQTEIQNCDSNAVRCIACSRTVKMSAFVGESRYK